MNIFLEGSNFHRRTLQSGRLGFGGLFRMRNKTLSKNAAGGQVVVEEDDIHQLFEPEVLRFNRFNRQRDTS